MKFLVENWYLIVVGIVVLAFIITGVTLFFKMPRKKQIECVKKWLLYAVIQAEKELGSGTGQLKLRFVYNMFIERFGELAKVISFDMLSILVDEALLEMKKLLESNTDIEGYIKAVPKNAVPDSAVPKGV